MLERGPRRESRRGPVALVDRMREGQPVSLRKTEYKRRGARRRATVPLLAATVAAVMVGCEANDPWRSADPKVVQNAAGTDCQRIFSTLDKEIWSKLNDPKTDDDDRTKFLQQKAKEIREENSSCWKSSYEQHNSDNPSTNPPYDLFVAEFDDQGMPTDKVARGLQFKQSEIYLIEQKLREILAEEDQKNGGINLIVFTHGWHGDAQADNNYSIEIKAILQEMSSVEASSPLRTSTNFYHTDATGNQVKVATAPRRTVGVEIAWRGDSLENPKILFIPGTQNVLNIWDRKHAAETVAKGSIHDLLEFLNDFYLKNSCNDGGSIAGDQEARCDRVHMLTIGHSFGALITFSTLIGRIERGLNSGCDDRAYAFGDLTFLLNPAFEGSRYAPVFESAMHHPDVFGHFPGGAEPDGVCASVVATTQGPSATPNTAVAPVVQLPVMVTLQSAGDTATGKLFPIFKFLTTSFTNTPFDDETRNEREAAGWVAEFRTHQLGLQTSVSGDTCFVGPSDPKWYCPRGWQMAANQPTLNSSVPLPDQNEVLQWAGTKSATVPQYMPIWSVMVSSTIMANHDDIWNPRIVKLMGELFRDAFEQADERHYSRARQFEQSRQKSRVPVGVPAAIESVPIRR
jgi:hypothetical protein